MATTGEGKRLLVMHRIVHCSFSRSVPQCAVTVVFLCLYMRKVTLLIDVSCNRCLQVRVYRCGSCPARHALWRCAVLRARLSIHPGQQPTAQHQGTDKCDYY